MMAGGAVTGGLIMAFNVHAEGPARRYLRVLRDRPLLWFIVSVLVGMVVAAIAVVAAKQFTGKSDAELESATLATA